MAPDPLAEIGNKPIRWAAKNATSKASRASVMMIEAAKAGEARAGRDHARCRDAGDPSRYVNDFTYATPTPTSFFR